MENKTCNTNKWIGLKNINETYERLKTHKNDESKWKSNKMNIKTIRKQENQTNETQKTTRNEWKETKDEKVSENEKGERKLETYESLINGILRSVWGIEMKHVIWQWNHGNHIEKDRIIVVDPKMENKTCNTEK